jgi:hypothetical protein
MQGLSGKQENETMEALREKASRFSMVLPWPFMT